MNPSYDNNFDSLNPGGPAQSGNSSEPPTPQSIQQPTSQSTPQFVQQAPIQPTPQLPQQFPEQPLQPISSGQGDIVLAPSKPKKTKKWTIALVVIVALAAIATTVAVITEYSTRITAPDSLISAYNKYANYVLYGKEDSSNIAEENEAKRGYFLNYISDEENWRSEIDDKMRRALELEEVFYNLAKDYKYEDSEGSPSFLAQIQKQHKLLQFIQSYYTKTTPSTRDLVEYYKKNGADATKKYIEEYYNFEKENNIIKEYKTAFLDWGDAVVNRQELFATNGCAYGDSECLSSAGSDKVEQAEELLKTMREKREVVVSYANAINEYYYVMFEINNMMGVGL